MKVRVLVFASLKDVLGADQFDVELADDALVSDALEILTQQHEALSDLRDSLAVAVNATFATPSTPLSSGDELALIPPVSGG